MSSGKTPSGLLQTSNSLTPGVRAAAEELGLEEVSDAVDVLLDPTFSEDDLSTLLEALEGGDAGPGAFQTGFTPRGESGVAPMAKRARTDACGLTEEAQFLSLPPLAPITQRKQS
jgi:hypothetical protein